MKLRQALYMLREDYVNVSCVRVINADGTLWTREQAFDYEMKEEANKQFFNCSEVAKIEFSFEVAFNVATVYLMADLTK